MTMYTYTNSFHSTSAQSKFSPSELETAYAVYNTRREETPAYKAGKRLWKALCGHKDCECCNWYGAR